MKHKVDLHGLSYKEAVKKAEMTLVGASFDKAMVVEIITGKSKEMQDRIIKEVIEVYKFPYYIPAYNTGMIIVEHDEIL